MVKTLHHYVNGQRVSPKGGRFGDVFNPATGEVSGKVPLASAAEVGEAVAAAKAAFTRSLLAFEFRAPVNTQRIRLVLLRIEPVFGAVKHVIRRNCYVRGVRFATRNRKIFRPTSISSKRPLDV